MNILGISAHYHDSAAALVVDGVPVCAVQEERLSRRKNDASFPLASIEWCLDRAGLTPEQLDAVVFYEKPMLKFERILTTALRGFPRTWRTFARGMKSSLGDKLWVKGIVASTLGISARKVLFTEHHQAHAATAFLTAPTRAAAILTADGVGEWATLSIGRGRVEDDGSTRIETLREIHFPHSLGMLYSTFTAWLGFPVNEGEYKVMGLAAYGRPLFEAQLRRILRRTADGAFELDLSYFDYHLSARNSYSPKFLDTFGPARDPWDPIDLRTEEGRRLADVAASVQRVLEDTLLDLARSMQRELRLPDLCLGGGVALNGCANARILRESGFDRVFVPSAPGDAGCALGAALYVDRIHFGNRERPIADHPFWGPDAQPSELERLATEDGLRCERLDDAELLPAIAAELRAGRVVAWVDGACELGPRALGHRSILAAPNDAEMRDRLNRSIKFREEFRPFAPAVAAEAASRYFDLPPGGDRLARFMSGVFPVRAEWRERLAAVTHVDGTARVQVVERAMAPRFHSLLLETGRHTGVPVLLNTSLNVAGEPIVSSAAEAYSTFRRSGIDLLVCGPVVVAKTRAAQAAPEEAVA